jgi:hypothetical protein
MGNIDWACWKPAEIKADRIESRRLGHAERAPGGGEDEEARRVLRSSSNRSAA